MNPELQPWIAVFGFMQDLDYRQQVVQVALGHLDCASNGLQHFAGDVFEEHREKRGFRSFRTTPKKIAQRHILHTMDQVPIVAETVICLWAEASTAALEEVAGLIAASGWRVSEGWDWEKGRQGFADLSAIPELQALFDRIGAELEHPQHDNLLLGLLWLSGGLAERKEHDDESAHVALTGAHTGTDDPIVSLTMTGDANMLPADEDEIVEVTDSTGVSCEEPDKDSDIVPGNREWTSDELISGLQCRTEEWRTAQAATQRVAQGLIDAAESGALEALSGEMGHLGEVLRHWQRANEDLANVTQTALLRVRRDIEMRPDLLETDSELWLEELAADSPIQGSASLVGILSDVQRYDEEEARLQAELSSLIQRLVVRQDELYLWTQEAAESFTLDRSELGADGSLQALRSALQEIEKRHVEMERQLAVLRDSSISRTLALSASLGNDASFEQAAPVWRDWGLNDVAAGVLGALRSEDLRAVEQALNEVVSQHITDLRAGDLVLVAGEMAVLWDFQRFPDLVEAIAKEKRDVETTLAIVAARAAHPWEGVLQLSTDVVDSFLRGLGQIAGTLGVAGLLSLSMSALLQSWVPDEDLAQAKLFLYLIAAKYAGTYKLPGELLFSVAADWPLRSTPGWVSLWESALYDSPLPSLIDQDHDEARDYLNQTRLRVEQLFVREGFKPTGLRSIQSSHHLKMLRQELLPRFEKWWMDLGALEREILNAEESYEFARLQKLLGKTIAATEAELNPSSLEELYDHARHQTGVEDSQPFHRRTSLRALATYEEALREYSHALQFYVANRASSGTVLTTTSLLAELASYTGLQPIGQEVLTQLRQSSDGEKPEWDSDAASQDLAKRVMELLLSQSAYAQRVPRMIGYLASSAFRWEALLEPLLADLSDPLDAEAAAQALVESSAPDQALFLAQQIPLRLQKQAQLSRARLEKETVRCQRELLAVEIPFDDLASDRELGRWSYVVRVMTERLQAARTKQVAEEERAQHRVRDLMRSINQLEMRVLEAQDEFLVTVREQAERVLDLCRQAARQNLLLDEVEGQLSEFDFRLQHKSWPLQELRETVERLETAIRGETRPINGLSNVEGVRDLLKLGDYTSLGLTEAVTSSISVATRCDLLDDWLELRDLAWPPGNKPNVTQRRKLRHFYASFARMMAMAQVKSPSGEPVVYDDEIFAAHWELRYPKVAGLKRNCLLIALPGDPPSPQHLKTLNEVIDDTEWLTYAFVLLFAPGLSPEQRKRLQQSYARRPFILIDESVVLDMTLAERRSRSPLGVLRPLMLDSLGADKVDVFEINQAVNAEMGVFVGRDSLIDRLVSSGGNYALYGGRRIGKSSILRDVEKRLERQGAIVVSASCEGDKYNDDDAIARRFGRLPILSVLQQTVETVGDLKFALQAHLDLYPDARFLFTLDEIDRYVKANPDRHILIEAFRALSEQFGRRFRVVVAGFMDLYDCLQGRGPYSPSSDPWQRMLNDPGPIGNLRAASAEMIVREGFHNILGWDFENRAIPRWIVERTGGHPAFVQKYCLKLQDLVSLRSDGIIRLRDVEEIFADDDPDASFISYVRKTLNMNLEIGSIDGIVAQYVILYLSAESSEMQGFTFDEAQEIAASSNAEIPKETLHRSLERLKVTSVVQERSTGVYEFSVPDYPGILHRLGDTAHLERLERALKQQLCGDNG